MSRLALVLALCGAPALADGADTWVIGIQSYAQIFPTNGGGCIAEVHIFNHETDNRPMASGSLWLGDLHVGIAYQLNKGPQAAERYQLFPPDGYAAIPNDFYVTDNETGVALICEWLGG